MFCSIMKAMIIVNDLAVITTDLDLSEVSESKTGRLTLDK